MEIHKGKLRDSNGLTGYQWMLQLFEYENCSECGRGVRSHDAEVLLGNWFARCRARYFTGKVGVKKTVSHLTLRDAEAWIEQRRKVDPNGVARGDYYLDGPGGESVEPLPLCARAMKCLCAAHAKGRDAVGPCDANEDCDPERW